MKLAFTTSGDRLEAPLDSRFGRAPAFLIYDLDSGSCARVDNLPNLNAVQGAGVQAAQAVIRAGAQAVITGHCGPKAFKVLCAANVKIYHSNAATVAEALEQYRQGLLPQAAAADVERHWA